VFIKKYKEGDIDVIKAALNGNDKAFSLLMEKYYSGVEKFIVHKIGNKNTDVEDLTIEVFSKAFIKLEQYSSDYAFSTWLLKIANNSCIDYFRKNNNNEISFQNINDLNENDIVDYFLSSEDHIINEQSSKYLEKELKQLKPKYLKLIKLRYYNQLSYNEIADELGISLSSVKIQLYRAKKEMSNILNLKNN